MAVINPNYQGITLQQRSNPYSGLFEGIKGFAQGVNQVGKDVVDMADAQDARTKHNQMAALRKQYEDSIKAGNDLNEIKANRLNYMGGKPTMLGYLDHPEIEELTKKSSPESQMQIAMQMKALGDSTLYDEIVRKQNMAMAEEQLKAQKSANADKASEIEEARYQRNLPKMEYDLGMRLSEIDGLLSTDKEANATEEVNKAIKDAVRAGMRQEDVYKFLNSKNEFKEYAKLLGAANAVKAPSKPKQENDGWN